MSNVQVYRSASSTEGKLTPNSSPIPSQNLEAYVLTIENAWRSYRNRLIFKLLKHAIRAAEDFLASQILQRVCPKEASLLNDPCMRVKVRLRFGGDSFPPLIYFKIFLSNKNGEGVKYITGRRMMQPYPRAVRSACSQMGARAFLDQLAVDTLQHRTHGVADEIDVCTLKDYMKYASVLDETPAYLGGRENSWRLLTLEGLPRHVMFYDVVEFVYSRKMSSALWRELPKLLAPPVNHMVHMEHIRILSQYRPVPDGRVVPTGKTSPPRGSGQSTSRRSKEARRRAVKMRSAYLGAADHDDDFVAPSRATTVGRSLPTPIDPDCALTSPTGTQQVAGVDNSEVEAGRLYEWTQNLSVDDDTAATRDYLY